MDESNSTNINSTDIECVDNLYSLEQLVDLANSISADIKQMHDMANQYVNERDRRKEPTWLNSCETMKLLKISKRTIQRYRDEGVLRFTVFHKNYRYRYIDVMALVIDKNRI